MQQAAVFWDKTAEKYAKSPIADLEAYNFTLSRTRSYLTPTDNVLELGCGTGSTALVLADDVNHILATDVSGRMVGIGEKKARDQGISNVDFRAADVFSDTIGEGPYDAILALNLLHLLEDVPAAIGRVNALLKPGGVFVSKTVCKPGKGASMKFRLIRAVLPLMQILGKAPFVQFMAARELEDIITAEGFKILEAGDHPPPSRYIVARKPL